MKLITVSPECCDKCLSKCLEFRLKIEECAIRGYDIDFNITQVCTEYHKNQTKITPPVPRKAVITKMPAIPEVEEQITPVVTKIRPYAIKKTGVQKLMVNPKWSLKRVEMGVQMKPTGDSPIRRQSAQPVLGLPFDVGHLSDGGVVVRFVDQPSDDWETQAVRRQGSEG
ncbi:hypothetical protein DUI87_02331 [Hirundo rustica rustica]|uniref:Uncharacterized protein n=1 Tax=Hirundo rustica rustica TaxID=333673 RepID=A0A3M0L7Z1_HIRRU|nr:hypothetical protein DUI87_02331 [Hirundo rustica rustica]